MDQPESTPKTPLPPPLPVRTAMPVSPAGRRTWVWVTAGVVGMVVVALAVGSVLYLAMGKGWRPAENRVAENRAARQQEVVRAYSAEDAAASVSDADRAAIAALFEQIADAMQSGRRLSPEQVSDADRMLDEMQRGTTLSRVERQGFRVGVQQGVSKILAGESGMGIWQGTEIRLVRPLGKDEAMVYARHRSSEGVTTHMRWWMIRGASWRVYDWEDLDGGLRATSLMASLVAAANNNPQLLNDVQAVQQAMAATNVSDFEAADAALKRLSGRTLPPDMDSVRGLAAALVHMSRAEWEASLAELDQAQRNNPNMIVAHLLRAVVKNVQGEYEAALAECERVISQIGYLYPEVALQKGQALQALERVEEAREVFRQGLDDEPDSMDCLAGLAQCLEESAQDEIGQRFAQSAMSQAQFRDLTSEIHGPQTGAALRAVVEAYEQRHGRSLDSDYYRAMVHFLDEQYEPVAALLKPHLSTKDEYFREVVLESYLSAMAEMGKAVEGYRAVPDRPEEAFEALVAEMAYLPADELGPLQELIRVHRAARPDDPASYIYEGQVAQRNERYAEADAAFAAAMTRVDDAEARERLLRQRVAAHYAMGRGMAAYTSLRPDQEGFDQVAALYAMDEDVAGLEALLAAHRERAPQDVMLPLWTAELRYLQGQYEEAVALLAGTEVKEAEQYERGFYYRQDRLLRSLIRLGRATEALAIAERPNEQGYVDPWWVALAAGGAGDGERTAAAIGRCLEEYYELEDFYADEDLGAALQGEKLAAVRVKYPPPTTQAVEPDM